MKKKPKIGRPELPENEKRQVVSIRLSETERRAIELAAKVSGESTSRWIRRTLASAAGRDVMGAQK